MIGAQWHGPYRNTELDETFKQIIANSDLFRSSKVALRGGLELMTEVANLLLQYSRRRGVPGRLSHVGRNGGSLDDRCEAEKAIVGWIRPQSPRSPTISSLYIPSVP